MFVPGRPIFSPKPDNRNTLWGRRCWDYTPEGGVNSEKAALDGPARFSFLSGRNFVNQRVKCLHYFLKISILPLGKESDS